MRRYCVPTICRKTGDESYLVVNAENSEQATKLVQNAGFITGVPTPLASSFLPDRSSVARADLVPSRDGSPKRLDRFSLLVLAFAGVVIVVSVSVLLFHLSRHLEPTELASATSKQQRTESTIEASPVPLIPRLQASEQKPSPPMPPVTQAPTPELADLDLGSADLAGTPKTKLSGSYMLIPVQGVIGEDVLASGVDACLRQAIAKGVRTVVFDIDSPGGSVDEAYRILDVLKIHDEIATVARVRHAISAAMVFVVASDAILVHPDSTLGGAVAYSKNQTTGEVEIDAKRLSLWGARLAATASAHHHDPSVVWAMCVMERSVYVYTDLTKKQSTIQDHPCQTPGDCRMLDGPSTVLTLDGTEAIDLGFAFPATGDKRLAIAEDFGEILSGRSMMEQAANDRRRMLAQVAEKLLTEKIERENARREAEELERQRQQQTLEAARQYDRDVAEVKGLVQRIYAFMDDARAKHPRQYSDYFTDYYGNYTRASVENWRHRSNQATQAWKNVKAGLQDIAKRMQTKNLDDSEPEIKAEVERLFDETNLEINRLDSIRSYPQ
jgi:ATP-dependent protease ClpP protease subunit